MILEAVVFDMDGVLVDSEPLHYAAESEMFARLRVNIPDVERHTFIGMSGSGMWSAIRAAHSLEMTVEELLEFDRKHRLEFFSRIDSLALMDGALDLLSDIASHDVKIALASSSSPELIDLVLERLGVSGLFGALVSGDTVPRGKPAPDIYLRATELLAVRPQHAVAVEDSRNGVISAKSAGLRCVAYRSQNSPGQDLSEADVIIDDFCSLGWRELWSLAEKWS